jgi:hypothetical protein
MAGGDNYVYLTLPKGVKPPKGYGSPKTVKNNVLYKKKVSVEMFSALDLKKIIKKNISKSKGGKKQRTRKHAARKHRTRKH